MHPLAGQGLNLGLRDVAALAEVVVEQLRLGLDPGAREPLAEYQRRRRFDALTSGLGMDAMNRLFSNEFGRCARCAIWACALSTGRAAEAAADRGSRGRPRRGPPNCLLGLGLEPSTQKLRPTPLAGCITSNALLLIATAHRSHCVNNLEKNFA